MCNKIMHYAMTTVPPSVCLMRFIRAHVGGYICIASVYPDNNNNNIYQTRRISYGNYLYILCPYLYML